MTATLIHLVLVLVLAGLPAAAAPAAAVEEKRDATRAQPGSDQPGVVLKDTVAGGTHWRLMTERGPVHIWRPPGLDLHTAGTLVYLHGFYTSADQAWEQHHLAEQFRQSRRNAVFVVPETPAGGNERVAWTDLDALLDAVQSRAHVSIPPGPVAVMGHSGAFRTILAWLGSPRLEQITLLDGFYNSDNDFAAWLNAPGSPPAGRRMVLVGFETAERTEAFLPGFAEALHREGVPQAPGQFRRRERQAKLLYVHSQYDHMRLVTEGKAIPVLLRLAPFRPL